MKTDHICELTAEMKQEVKQMIERRNRKHTRSAAAGGIGAMLALLGVLHLAKCMGSKVIVLLCKDAAAEEKPESEPEALVDGDTHAG